MLAAILAAEGQPGFSKQSGRLPMWANTKKKKSTISSLV